LEELLTKGINNQFSDSSSGMLLLALAQRRLRGLN
jgi:hypothetical protein